MGVTFIAPQEVYTSPAKLTTKSITENGTYSAVDDSANGYSSVTVNVPLPTGKITITENGTDINIAQYAKADVNVEGGGGETWNTVFEGSVTTEAGQGGMSVSALNVNITADTIKTTFNGTEYTCNRQPYDIFGAPFNDDLGEFDFSEYPFAIAYDSDLHAWNLITPSSGTYTLKIEEEQGGGSSDFSTATLTLTRGESNDGRLYVPNLMASPIGTSLFPFINDREGTNTHEIVVYSGGTVLIYDGTNTVTIDGNIQDLGNGSYLITGDGTITLS